MNIEDVKRVAQHAMQMVPPDDQLNAMNYAMNIAMRTVHTKFKIQGSLRQLQTLPTAASFIRHAHTTGTFCPDRTKGLVVDIFNLGLGQKTLPEIIKDYLMLIFYMVFLATVSLGFVGFMRDGDITNAGMTELLGKAAAELTENATELLMDGAKFIAENGVGAAALDYITSDISSAAGRSMVLQTVGWFSDMQSLENEVESAHQTLEKTRRDPTLSDDDRRHEIKGCKASIAIAQKALDRHYIVPVCCSALMIMVGYLAISGNETLASLCETSSVKPIAEWSYLSQLWAGAKLVDFSSKVGTRYMGPIHGADDLTRGLTWKQRLNLVRSIPQPTPLPNRDTMTTEERASKIVALMHPDERRAVLNLNSSPNRDTMTTDERASKIVALMHPNERRAVLNLNSSGDDDDPYDILMTHISAGDEK